jgi:uncharacterized protein YhbP (UPF0306 family)
MRVTRGVLVVAAAIMLASCNTYRVAGAMTYGRTQELSAAAIETALAAYHRKFPDRPPAAQIQVVSRSEIRLYGDSACCYSTMERKHDRWEFAGDQILWTE